MNCIKVLKLRLFPYQWCSGVTKSFDYRIRNYQIYIQSLHLPKYSKNNSISNYTSSSNYITNSKRCCSGTKIYTKTGDKGTSSLYTGERRPKDDAFFEALGNIDELSAWIGLTKEFANEKKHEYAEQLERIQCILQDIGTLIATPKPKLENKSRQEKLEKRLRFNPRHITELEEWIDKYTTKLPPLSNFILPGGGQISASIHICRTVCRRAERCIIPLTRQEVLDNQVAIYINRLSDYFFTIARYATILDKKKETTYIRPHSSMEESKE